MKDENIKIAQYGAIGAYFAKHNDNPKPKDRAQAYQQTVDMINDAMAFFAASDGKPGTLTFEGTKGIGQGDDFRLKTLKEFAKALSDAVDIRHQEMCAKSAKGILGFGGSKNTEKIKVFNKVKGALQAFDKPLSGSVTQHQANINSLLRALEQYKKFIEGKLGVEPQEPDVGGAQRPGRKC